MKSSYLEMLRVLAFAVTPRKDVWLTAYQAFVVTTLAMALYTGWSGLSSGLEPVGVIFFALVLGFVTGVLAASAVFVGWCAYKNLQVRFWPTVYFIEEGRLVHELRVQGADADAPAAAYFNMGSAMLAFKWPGHEWSEERYREETPGASTTKTALTTAKEAHDLMSARYATLPPVDPGLIVSYGGYIKRNMPLSEALGDGWRWGTKKFFYHYSPLRVDKARAKVADKSKKLDPTVGEDLLAIMGEMKFKIAPSITPTVLYERLESNTYGQAIKAVLRRGNTRVKALQQLSLGVIAIMVLSIILLFAVNSGQTPDETDGPTPIEATSTAVALGQAGAGN